VGLEADALGDEYRHGVEMRVSGMPSVSRGDLAHLMLALLSDETSKNASITVTSAKNA
jgi:hypothetical protein